ncbi:hypothetical protein PMIN06_006774 [Paraphaeosphaeria minitans]
MLKAINTMADLMRPAADGRTARPTTHDDVAKQPAVHHAQPAVLHEQPILHDQPAIFHDLPALLRPQNPILHDQPAPAPAATRRLSRTLAPPAEGPNPPDSLRKRSIAHVDTPEAPPRSNTRQRRSYDDLSTWADDATKKLHSNVDDVACRPSTPTPTPTPEDTPAAMADKKSLRSKASVRKPSVLAEIFTPEGYDDILAGFDAVDSAETNASSIGSDDQMTLVDEPLTPAQLAEYRETLKQTATRLAGYRETLKQTPLQLADLKHTPPEPKHVYTPLSPEHYSPYLRLPATADPLADDVYTKEHKRHEREERKERNLDVERHQFRLSKAPAVLEELEGDDWHKVFVIGKSVRRPWEPKRAHVTTLLRTALARQDAFRDIELKKRRREKEKRKREREGTDEDDDDDDDGEDEHPKRRPPRPPRPSNSHPSPAPTSPPKRRPPRPQGYLLDIPPTPLVPATPFKSFYPKGHRPAFLATNNNPDSTTTTTKPSPRKATRSAAPPPLGVPLPSILTRVDDEVLLDMLKADQQYAREGLPTEEALLEDERSFGVFVLGGEFVTGAFLRENERMRRVRRRTRASTGTGTKEATRE